MAGGIRESLAGMQKFPQSVITWQSSETEVFKVGIFDFLNKKAAQQKPTGKVIRHIVCLCYDAPNINSLKPQMQDFIIKAEQERGSIIAPTSRITFDSFYDNSDLEKPDMIRQKLEQVYC